MCVLFYYFFFLKRHLLIIVAFLYGQILIRIVLGYLLLVTLLSITLLSIIDHTCRDQYPKSFPKLSHVRMTILFIFNCLLTSLNNINYYRKYYKFKYLKACHQKREKMQQSLTAEER